MRAQLVERGFAKPIMFAAVDGETLDLPVLFTQRIIAPHARKDMSPGEYGCALSHLQVWKSFLTDSDKDFLLVFEDDIGLAVSAEYLESMPLPEDLHLLQLGWAGRTRMVATPGLDIEKVSRNTEPPFGGFAYILSRDGAKQLSDMAQVVDVESDEFFSRGHKRGLNCYVHHGGIVSHLDVLPRMIEHSPTHALLHKQQQEKAARANAKTGNCSPSSASPPAVAWSRPEVQRVKDPEPWVITACDEKFFPWMAAFVGSLKDVAGFTGQVGIVDWGLNAVQREHMHSAGVTLIPPLQEKARIMDRYLTVAEYFADRPDNLIAYFDADIWFAGSLDTLFAESDLRLGRLGAAADVVPCDYYFRCSFPRYHDQVQQLLVDVRAAYGEALQAGVVVGRPQAWMLYAQRMRELVEEGWIQRPWGSDALALNLLARDCPHNFKQLTISWNAPPLWGIRRSGQQFFIDNPSLPAMPVSAIHRTSGVRGKPGLDMPMQDYYPKVAAHWAWRFELEVLP